MPLAIELAAARMRAMTPAQIAARLADRMRRLVYLSTVHPAPGSSVDDMMTHPQAPVARGIDYATMFCNDLDSETSEWLLSRLGPEPPGPMAEKLEPVALPPELASTYVLLERDEALPPDFQRLQARTAGAGEIVSFDAGHSAFASRPHELAELLLRFA